MNIKSVLIFVFLLAVINFNGVCQEHKVRIGFFGNSITIGSGLSQPKDECYPAQIGELLTQKYGDTCIVENFAVSGRTLLKNGDFPLWDEDLFHDGWKYAPDICFICLGTNDTKPQNWDSFGNEFMGDYLTMIDTFKLRNPNTKFIVCYPPPAYDVVWGIRNSVIVNEVIPILDSVMEKREAILIDFYNPLIDSVYLFPDKIHPNAVGAKVMAKIAFDRMVETDIIHKVTPGHTFVTGFNSNKQEIGVNDTAILSWTTTNATQVYLNGETVELNGSLSISPDVTTEYVLLAVGSQSGDSIVIVQDVYQSELTLISIEPYRATIFQGQSINLDLYFYDQKGDIMTDTAFSIDWTILEGSGTLTNQTDTSVTFVADKTGKSKVQAAHGNISFKATITVEIGSTYEQSEIQELKVFPNPCGDYINLSLDNCTEENIVIEIFDVLGCLKIQKRVNISYKNSKVLSLNSQKLKAGLYFYKISANSKSYSGIINKTK